MSCPAWVQLQGFNPNTGQPMDEWKCSDTWVPLLLIENSQQQRQTGAAVESFRNEMVKGNTQFLTAMKQQENLLEKDTDNASN